ncbi:ROK family protein (putative glucokinase) [Chitinophaga costaii]|uniref:ROK family protein (Putative glucokinase) n=1 Tax=Chitinophaga costaii TaxID=1335309 RepID=A0A1C4FNY9_9BACT|nr:ROK family protein [Chitinophaga costaii]PUZ29918.1 ROK family protein [Chitinophaga costaii]SCC57363.1 ROK family protein (putative glucokinase) [Chitinophaga costaii]
MSSTFIQRPVNTLQKRILKQLYFEKAQSCATLSEYLDKSIPVVTKALMEMVEDGLVVEQGFAASQGGRRPQMYSLPSRKLYTVAVAMDQLTTRIAIMDLLNEIVTGTKHMVMDLENNEEALPTLIKEINAFIIASGLPKEQMIGVGIGMPGFVNTREGRNLSYLHSGEVSLEKYLERAIGLPVHIDNDSSVIALAELKFGLAKKHEQVMVINVSWGIGLGMIVNGQLFRGHSGYAGELSHIPIADDGTLCVCGKRGCLETEASLLVVAQKATAAMEKGHISSLLGWRKDSGKLMGDAVIEAANKGDQFAIEILSEIGYKIGKGLAILIHIMNPELIILSGRGTGAGKVLMAPIQQALNKYCIPSLAAYTDIQISQLAYDAELLGAAALVMETFDEDVAK